MTQRIEMYSSGHDDVVNSVDCTANKVSVQFLGSLRHCTAFFVKLTTNVSVTMVYVRTLTAAVA